MNEPVAGFPKKDAPKDPEVLFDCQVRSRDLPGQAKILTLEAPSKEIAVQRLIAQGYVVISVHAQGEKKSGFWNIFSRQSSSSGKASKRVSAPIFNRVSTRETIFFGVQLATLLKAGIPLLRSLEIVQRGVANPYFRKVLGHMRKRITEGGTFSIALRTYPDVFPWVWMNLVEVGEATGKLPDCLEEIVHYQESAARIKGKIITAFFYPAILTVAVIGALTFLLLFIVPKFAAIFEAQKMPLPVLTQIVVATSNVLRFNFLWVAGAVVAVGITLAYTSKAASIKLVYDRLSLNAPLFGPILLQVSVVRFTRSLGTLLRSGVQILQALEISGRLVENKHLEASIKRVAQRVRGGQGLGLQLEVQRIYPVFVTQLIAIGEESGQLDRFLDLLSNYYEEQVDAFLARLTTLLEPFLLVFMGGVIGTIVISMFLPIVELSTQAGMH
ncbi:MAG: type II secretion system F family protein [Candidatus Omnitrophota bacterium]